MRFLRAYAKLSRGLRRINEHEDGAQFEEAASMLAAAESALSAGRQENAELRASREAWQWEAVDGREVLKHHADRARQAEAEVSRLRQDAEREAVTLLDYANEVSDEMTSTVLRGAAVRLKALASRSRAGDPTTQEETP